MALFSSLDSHSRGVAILLKKNLPINIKDKFADTNGNLLGLLLEYESKLILLHGIYGPNVDSPGFFESEVFKKIESWNPDFTIFSGDWNIILNKDLDTLNYRSIGNIRAREVLINKINELGLVDIFRELNPTGRKYTWKQWGSHKFGRLDYFLVSSSLLPFISGTKVLAKCFSDHSPIELDIDFSHF